MFTLWFFLLVDADDQLSIFGDIARNEFGVFVVADADNDFDGFQ